MKHTLLLLMVLAFLLGCAKNMVKVRNNYSEDLKSFKIGDTDYGTVKSDTETEHKEIKAGDNDIKIDGKKVGALSLPSDPGKAIGHFTLEVKEDDAGSFELSED
jgi:phage anti-repressor protein